MAASSSTTTSSFALVLASIAVVRVFALSSQSLRSVPPSDADETSMLKVSGVLSDDVVELDRLLHRSDDLGLRQIPYSKAGLSSSVGPAGEVRQRWARTSDLQVENAQAWRMMDPEAALSQAHAAPAPVTPHPVDAAADKAKHNFLTMGGTFSETVGIIIWSCIGVVALLVFCGLLWCICSWLLLPGSGSSTTGGGGDAEEGDELHEVWVKGKN